MRSRSASVSIIEVEHAELQRGEPLGALAREQQLAQQVLEGRAARRSISAIAATPVRT